ncbi:MATE family efflux transporter [Polyangium fumosum]|uniref:MATE family efflux transporter n=1 Tax=Polyangium fumosum TaxID=889272 RepID=UPI001478E0B4|nr:MATE family efflux transporter [Polyangium fumosum]
MRETAALAMPLAGFQLGYMLMGIVDFVMVGRLGALAMAGVGVGSAVWTAFQVIGVGLLLGLDPLFAQAIGARRHARARAVLRQGLVLAALASIPLALAALSLPRLFALANVEPEVASVATSYVHVRLWGLLPTLMTVAVRSYLQATQQVRTLVVAMVIANIVNAVANALLVFGDGSLHALGLPGLGLPALGVEGSALATVISTVVALAILLWRATRGRQPDEVEESAPLSLMLTALRVGVPVALQLLAEVGAFSAVTTLAGSLGSVPAAAHSLANTVMSFLFSIALGVGSATTVRVGYAVGREDAEGVRMAWLAGLLVGCGTMVFGGLLLFVAPTGIARLLTDDETVVAAAPALLRIAALYQVCDGAQVVSSAALRGAGDTWVTVYAYILGYYALGLPLGVVLGLVSQLGVVGLWWGLALGVTTAAMVLLLRFRIVSSRPIIRV